MVQLKEGCVWQGEQAGKAVVRAESGCCCMADEGGKALLAILAAPARQHSTAAHLQDLLRCPQRPAGGRAAVLSAEHLRGGGRGHCIFLSASSAVVFPFLASASTLQAPQPNASQGSCCDERPAAYTAANRAAAARTAAKNTCLPGVAWVAGDVHLLPLDRGIDVRPDALTLLAAVPLACRRERSEWGRGAGKRSGMAARHGTQGRQAAKAGVAKIGPAIQPSQRRSAPLAVGRSKSRPAANPGWPQRRHSD